MCFRCRRNVGSNGELRILAGNKVQIFGAEIRNACEPNSRLYRVTVRTGKVAASVQCLIAKVAGLKCTRHSMGSQWRFWSNAVEESGEYGR